MNMQQTELLGITKTDIQDIFQNTIKQYKVIPRMIFLDANYLYTFHLDDFEIVKKFNILGRYDTSAVKEWHRCLERWLQDQTVILGDKTIKPIKISRSLDRVVNEGLELIAGCITGGSSAIFNFRGIGDGDIGDPSPADLTLYNLVDMIDVNTSVEGGSLTRDGSTVYSIGNHSKGVPTPANGVFTECGMFDAEDEAIAAMLDHSAFADPVPHEQNADAPGSTTVIYMCSA